MTHRNKVEFVEYRQIADKTRCIADEVERGKCIAFAFALCNEEGTGQTACMVDGERCMPDLMDEMIHEIKLALFESYGDEK
jgi:hypothetical protein